MKIQLIILLAVMAFSVDVTTASEVTGLTSFTSGTPAKASEVNDNFSAVKTAVDDNAADNTTNATDIAANSANITTNTAGIATNAANIPATLNAIGTFCVPDEVVVGMDASGNFECELPQTLAGFGTQNTRAGPGALANNTTGTLNSAFGDGTLNDNTEGGSNSAFGVNALGSNITGVANSAFGSNASGSNTTANGNGAFGFNALRFNTTGHSNSAFGSSALRDNTTSSWNSAFGTQALFQNAGGALNTAIGGGTLFSNITGSGNTAVGYQALSDNTGTDNIALGKSAGANYTTGNDNIAIGHSGFIDETTTIRIGTDGKQFKAYIAGIRSITTGSSNAITVMIDGNGQLGTANSSSRYKEDIRDMNTASERLLSLRPVTFRYKQAFEDGEKPVQYGLIAEEVAEVFPELVAYDRNGVPTSVKYHLLSTLLLNELQKQTAELVELKTQTAELATLKAQIADLQDLEIRLAQLETQMPNAATVAANR